MVSPWHEIAAATANNNGGWTDHNQQPPAAVTSYEDHQMVDQWPHQHHHNVNSIDTAAANLFTTTCSTWPTSIHDQSGIPSSSSFMKSDINLATTSNVNVNVNNNHHHNQGGWMPSLTEQQFMQTEMGNTGWTPPPQTGGGSGWDPLLYVSSVLG